MNIRFILSGNRKKASSRVRGFWISDELEELGCSCSILFKNTKIELLKIIFQLFKYDVYIFQKVYSKYHVLLVRILIIFNKKIYLDIDDYPSLTNDPSVMKNFKKMVLLSDRVFCGSKNLVKLVDKISKNKSTLIKTSINLRNYTKTIKKPKSIDDRICLGWIGNGKYYKDDLIKIIYPPLNELSKSISFKLKIIGLNNELELHKKFTQLNNVELCLINDIDWSNENLISRELNEIDIGLYPLLPNYFNKFKCGFKALEYMAMKIPVVASPVSYNKQIIQHNLNGFFAKNDNEWTNYLNQLIFDLNKRKSMGMTGYKFVKKNFSIEYAAKDILKIIS